MEQVLQDQEVWSVICKLLVTNGFQTHRYRSSILIMLDCKTLSYDGVENVAFIHLKIVH